MATKIRGVQEAAKFLGIAKRSVYRLLQDPDFPTPEQEEVIKYIHVWDEKILEKYKKNRNMKPGRPCKKIK